MSKRDKSLAKSHQGKPCIATDGTRLFKCGLPSNGDHIVNYKGDIDLDFDKNIWDLCHYHHVEKGTLGLAAFAKKHDLENELKNRGLEFNPIKKSWFWPRDKVLALTRDE